MLVALAMRSRAPRPLPLPAPCVAGAVLGALEFAGSLADEGYSAGARLVAGAVCALIGLPRYGRSSVARERGSARATVGRRGRLL